MWRQPGFSRQGRGEVLADVPLQGGVVAGRRQLDLPHVRGQVEVGYVAPAGPLAATGRPDRATGEDGVDVDQPTLHDRVEPLAIDRAVEEHDALDDHQILDAVHVQPDGVDRIDPKLPHRPSLSRGANIRLSRT